MSPNLCKKHKKPRTVIYERKMPRGGVFTVVGCEDCKKEALEAMAKRETSRQDEATPPKRKHTKKPEATPEVKPEAKPDGKTRKGQTLAKRFGFKL